MSQELDSFISIPLPTTLVFALLKRSPHGISGLIEYIAEDFLERTRDDFDTNNQITGIYWEAVFLPNGTELRTKYFGEYKIAKIENDRILWNGNEYPSFAKLANSMRGCTMNNAWKELQIKRPSDQKWLPAQSIRR